MSHGLLRFADDGIRTHTPFSRERILSPLRLPFRHIGVLLHFTLVIGHTKAFPQAHPTVSWQVRAEGVHNKNSLSPKLARRPFIPKNWATSLSRIRIGMS